MENIKIKTVFIVVAQYHHSNKNVYMDTGQQLCFFFGTAL